MDKTVFSFTTDASCVCFLFNLQIYTWGREVVGQQKIQSINEVYTVCVGYISVL